MKKLIALIAFLAVVGASNAQTYVTVGNTLQRAPTGLGWIYRFNMGVPGFMQLYTKQQVDSLINIAVGSGVTSFNTRTGAVVPLIGDYAAFYLPIDNPTFTNFLTGPVINIKNNAGTNRELRFSTGNSLRWDWYVNNTPEAGGNVGSDISLSAYADTNIGVPLNSPLTISRKYGTASFLDTVKALNFIQNGNRVVDYTRLVSTGTGLLGGGNLGSNLTLKPDTSVLQTVLNFFPKGDTRYERLSNKTATQSSSTTTYPNWLGVTNYVTGLFSGETLQTVTTRGDSTTATVKVNRLHVNGPAKDSLFYTNNLASASIKGGARIATSAGEALLLTSSGNANTLALQGTYSGNGAPIAVAFLRNQFELGAVGYQDYSGATSNFYNNSVFLAGTSKIDRQGNRPAGPATRVGLAQEGKQLGGINQNWDGWRMLADSDGTIKFYDVRRRLTANQDTSGNWDYTHNINSRSGGGINILLGSRGLRNYNTSDTTTNTEYFSHLWSGNALYLTTRATGTGTARSIILQSGAISSSNPSFLINQAASNTFEFKRAQASNSDPFVTFLNPSLPSGSYLSQKFGRSTSSQESGIVSFVYSSTAGNSRTMVSMQGLDFNGAAAGLGVNGNGQIGIWQPSPHASAILDIKFPSGNTQGVLITRASTSAISAISAPAEALFMWDLTKHMFAAYNGSTWNNLLFNPMTTTGDMIVGGTSGTPLVLSVNATATQKFLVSQSGSTGYYDLFGGTIAFTKSLAGASNFTIANTSSTGLGLTVQAGDATHYALQIQNYSLGTTALNVFGDGHADFAGIVSSTGFKINGATSGAVTITAPSTITPYTLTLPSAAPGSNGQVLAYTTGGIGSWTTPATGTLTSITAGTYLTGGTITTTGTIALDSTKTLNKVAGTNQIVTAQTTFTNSQTGFNSALNIKRLSGISFISGYNAMYASSSIPSSIGFRVNDGASGDIVITNSGTNIVNIVATNSTAGKGTFNLPPDVNGTIALTSDLPVAGSYSSVGTATTTFTVTIGTTQANNTYKVNVTPTDALAAGVFYVNNKTTTTFDVVYLSGLTGTVAFDWSLFK
jgi:hypothetical protein